MKIINSKLATQLKELLASNALSVYRKDSEEAKYISIDLTFIDCNSTRNKPDSTVNWVNLTMQSNPCLKVVILILKRLLKENSMNCPYTGGLSSFSVIVMVAAFFLNTRNGSVGELLFELLNFYGNVMDFENIIVDCSVPG